MSESANWREARNQIVVCRPTSTMINELCWPKRVSMCFAMNSGGRFMCWTSELGPTWITWRIVWALIAKWAFQSSNSNNTIIRGGFSRVNWRKFTRRLPCNSSSLWSLESTHCLLLLSPRSLGPYILICRILFLILVPVVSDIVALESGFGK